MGKTNWKVGTSVAPHAAVLDAFGIAVKSQFVNILSVHVYSLAANRVKVSKHPNPAFDWMLSMDCRTRLSWWPQAPL